MQRRSSRRKRLLVVAGLSVLLPVLVGVGLLGSGGDGEVARPAQAGAEKPAAEARLQRSRETRGAQREAIRSVLADTSFLRAGRPQARRIALTFDDGPGPQTEEILRILRRRDAPATFFISGNMLPSFHAITAQALRAGHAIGTHGFDHPHMGRLDRDEQAAQLGRVNSQLHAYGLPIPELFRPPYGSFDTNTLELLKRDSSLMVLWSVDTGDYLQPGSEAIVEWALQGAEPGAVILMHDAGGDRSQTIEALPEILAGLEKRNLEPVTVPELLASNPPPRGQSIEDAAAVKPPGSGTEPGGRG